MATELSFETPDLNKVFNLDNFKFNDLKNILADLFAGLNKLGGRFGDIDRKLANIPSASDIQKCKFIL